LDLLSATISSSPIPLTLPHLECIKGPSYQPTSQIAPETVFPACLPWLVLAAVPASTSDFRRINKEWLEEYRHIVIEGPIGVGKTSLAKRMAKPRGANFCLKNRAITPFLKDL
jgi:hypothetical protein